MNRTAKPAPPQPALELRHISRRFGDVHALKEVTFAVVAGSVHALLGENGAGKTTLMRIAYGLTQPDSGDVMLFGERVASHSVRRSLDAGVGMVQQHLSLVPSLTVAENLALGGSGLFRPTIAAAKVLDEGRKSGLSLPPHARVAELSVVEQQRLEILKALARNARLLILDEPTALLAPAEITELLRWIRGFARAGGSVVLVTHKLREALDVADAVTVLRRGEVAFSGPVAGTSAGVLARTVFPDIHEPRLPETLTPGEVVVRANALSLQDERGATRVRDVSLDIRRREIVGVAAVEGSGHRELLLALAGLRSPAAGTLELPSRVGIVPADRSRDALIPDFTLTENVALRGLASRRGLLRWREISSRTDELRQRFEIVAPSSRVRARQLSGGNQQRLVLARELAEDVDLLIADNPTRGLDIRATQFVHDQLRGAAARGAAVVVHSSDLDEVLSLASRVVVVFQGELHETTCDRELVGRAMLGADASEAGVS